MHNQHINPHQKQHLLGIVLTPPLISRPRKPNRLRHQWGQLTQLKQRKTGLACGVKAHCIASSKKGTYIYIEEDDFSCVNGILANIQEHEVTLPEDQNIMPINRMKPNRAFNRQALHYIYIRSVITQLYEKILLSQIYSLNPSVINNMELNFKKKTFKHITY